MRRTRLFIVLAIFGLVVAAFVSPNPAQAKKQPAPRPAVTDVMVVGADANSQNPVLLRFDQAGNLLWQRSPSLPTNESTGQVELALTFGGADRNVSEDALYLYASWAGAGHGEVNALNGMTRLQKYDKHGDLVWEIGLSPSSDQAYANVSANPVNGGVYVSDESGIWSVKKNGVVRWGPETFGLSTGFNSSWSVAADTRTGGAYVANYYENKVLHIAADGTVLWSADVPEPNYPVYSPADGGLYIGSGTYAHDTYKLSASGAIEWQLSNYPSPYTYARGASPVDGALYINSGWETRFAKVAPDGTEVFNMSSDDGVGHPFYNGSVAPDLFTDTFFATATNLNLGVWRHSGTDGVTLWSVLDPAGFGVDQWNSYAPWYRAFTGMPKFPPGKSYQLTPPSAKWQGTVAVDSWNGTQPVEVTLRGTMTAPHIGKANFTLTAPLFTYGGSFTLTTPNDKSTIAGSNNGYFPNLFGDGRDFAIAGPDTFTGKYSSMYGCTVSCEFGGTVFAFSVPLATAFTPGSSDPMSWSGPVLGNLAFSARN